MIDVLNESGADVVWVGLGAPKQEKWMAAHRERLTASVLIGVGAAFDFHTGRIRQAPRWMMRAGLECDRLRNARITDERRSRSEMPCNFSLRTSAPGEPLATIPWLP